jgi:hypothetical protein
MIQMIANAMLLTKARNIFSFIKLKLFIVVIASLPFDTIFKSPDLKKSSQVSNASTTRKQ